MTLKQTNTKLKAKVTGYLEAFPSLMKISSFVEAVKVKNCIHNVERSVFNANYGGHSYGKMEKKPFCVKSNNVTKVYPFSNPKHSCMTFLMSTQIQ